MTASSSTDKPTLQQEVDAKLRTQQVRAMVQTQSEITPIPKEREQAFREWLRTYNVTDLDAPDSHYDYRGAFLANAQPDVAGQWPATFQQSGAPQLSPDSQYAPPAPVPSVTTTAPVTAPHPAIEAFQQLSGDPTHVAALDAFSGVTPQNQAAVQAFRDIRPSTSTTDTMARMQQHADFPIHFPGEAHAGPFDDIILGAAKQLKDALNGAVNLVAGPPVPAGVPVSKFGAVSQSAIEQQTGKPFTLTDQQMRENQTAAAFIASSLVGGVASDVILAKMSSGVIKTALEGTAAGAAFGALRPKDQNESMLGAILADALMFGGMSLAGGFVSKLTKPITLGVDDLAKAGIPILEPTSPLFTGALKGTEYGKAIFEEIQAISLGLDAKGIQATPDLPFGKIIDVTQAAIPDNIGLIRRWFGSASFWGLTGGPVGDAADRIVTNFRGRMAVALRLRGEWDQILDEADHLITRDIPSMGGGLTEPMRVALVQQRRQALGEMLNDVFQPTDLPVTTPPDMVRAFGLIRDRLLAGREALRLFRGGTADWGIDAYLPHVFVEKYAITDAATEKVFAFANIKNLRQAAMQAVAQNPGVPLRIIPSDFVNHSELAGLGLTGQTLARFISSASRALSVDGDEIASVLFENHIARVKPGKKFFGHALQRGETPLAGWETDPFTALRIYASGEARALAFHDAEQKAGAIIEALGRLPGTGPSVESLKVYVDRVLGRPSKEELALRGAFKSFAQRAAARLTPGIQQIAEDYGDPVNLLSKLSGLEAHMRLGYSPTAWFTNLSQTITNTAAAIGYGPTIRAIRLFLDRSQYQQVDALLRAMDVNLAVPLTAADQITIRNIGQVSPWHPLYLFNKIETANRAIAGLAKYQEQILNGAGIREALDAARTFIKDTQFDYSVADAPRLLQGPLGANMFQFKKFYLKELEFVAQLPAAGKARFVANIWAIGGLTALFSLPPLMLLDWAVGQLTGEKITERAEALAPHLARGGPGFAGIDLGGNVAIGSPSGVGAGDLFGPGVVDLFTVARDLVGKETLNLITGKQGYITPQEKAQVISGLVPVMVRRLMDSYNVLETGMVQARGTTQLEFKPEDAHREALLTAFGFRSIARSEESRVFATNRRKEQLQARNEQAAVQAWAAAYLSGDSDRASRILQDAQDGGLYIHSNQLRDALAAAILERSMRGVKRAPPELRLEELQRVQQLQRP